MDYNNKPSPQYAPTFFVPLHKGHKTNFEGIESLGNLAMTSPKAQNKTGIPKKA